VSIRIRTLNLGTPEETSDDIGPERVQCVICGGLHVASVTELMTTPDPCSCPCCEGQYIERGLRALRAKNAQQVAAYAAEQAQPPLAGGLLRRGFPWHLFGRGKDPDNDGSW